ncbi:MAG: tetratricopeptide (TPR) repeat protein [Candidatus Latescibacterota bacterium]|jgi:tetratricopeptide (TPR) repeat protein
MMNSTAPNSWIISRHWDFLFFIGTPVLSLAALLFASNYFTSADIALFVLAFFAVGHHLPGLMRAYGEKELFTQYKARFIVAPCVIAFFVGWSVFNGHLGFFIFLALWDMWHFFMQHFGFMRIYEFKRRKPSLLSARLDWWLTATWFAYIVVASPHYLINFLERCHRYGFGFYAWLDPEWIFVLREWILYLALALSVVYAINLLRERRLGAPIVLPKIAISITTFATAYYAYIVLEDVILGYAITALAHDIQYFAIVWIYNNGVLKRASDSGRSFFRFLFKDGRLRIVLFYLFLIMVYGGIEAMARSTQNYLIYDIVKVLIATSAFMHYYYDGFIWKVRKKEIRQNLVDEEQSVLWEDMPVRRWSLAERVRGMFAKRTGLIYVLETGKQLVYFGVPIVFLAWTDTTYSLSDVQAKEYLVRLTPEVAKTHDDLGVAYSHKRLFNQSIEAHQKAIEADPNFAQAYTHLGIAHSLKGDPKAAIGMHLKAIDLDPQLAQAHYNLGVEYLQMGWVEDAVGAFERAVVLNPQYSRAFLALAQVYKKQGNKDLAIENLMRARDLKEAAERKNRSRSAMPWATGTPLKDDI